MSTHKATNETTGTLHSVFTATAAIIAVASTFAVAQFSRPYYAEANSTYSAKLHARSLDRCPYYPSAIACLQPSVPAVSGSSMPAVAKENAGADQYRLSLRNFFERTRPI
jgi:hypothetical protein